MFASLFGEELLRLMRLVLPASKINLADLVDLYLCSEEGLDISLFDNRPGTGDLLSFVHQKCREAEVSDVVDFLRLVAPIFVRDDRLLRKSFRGMSANQVSVFVHAINTLCKKENLSFLRHLRSDGAKAEELFSKHAGEEVPSRQWLRAVVKAMLTISVQADLRSTSDEPSVVKELRHMSNLDNVLNLARLDQWRLCNQIYQQEEKSKLAPSMLKEMFEPGIGAFSTEEDPDNAYKKVMHAVISTPPLAVACKLYLGKRTFYIDEKGSQIQATATERDNDVLIETGFVRTLLTDLIETDAATEEIRVLVIFPSPFFIREWAYEERTADVKTDFVVENQNYRDLMIRHFSNVDYSGAICDNFSFFSLDEWNGLQGKMPYSHVLVIEKHGINFDSFLSELKKSTTAPRIYTLTRDAAFSEPGSLSYGIGHDVHLIVDNLFLIPKGTVVDSTTSIKCFWSASARKLDSQKTLILRGLNIEKEIILMPASWIEMDLKDFMLQDKTASQKVSGTLRDYISAMDRINREVVSRDAPEIIHFSRELNIWYTVNKSSRHPEKVRPVIYFKEFPKDGRIARQLSDTVRTCKEMSLEDIPSYARNIYPYSAFKKKGEVVSPRDCVAREYRDCFAGKHISLTTALYLHPEWNGLVTSTVWTQMETLCKDPLIAFSTIDDLTEDDYSDRIAAVFPEKRDSVISNLVIGLSRMIEKAMEMGYADTNPVRQLAYQSGKSERAFLIMRKNLAKKTFTGDEFRRLYKAITNGIAKAGVSERGFFIGALIRLVTGIESNLLCALTWDDFAYLNDFGIYVFQIYRQVSNNGAPVVLLDDATDIRCIPCPPCLAGVILEWKNVFLDRYSSDRAMQLPIISNPLPEKGVPQHRRPYDLEKLLQDFVKELGLPEDLVSLPNVDDEMKTSNINIFQGDIFRENFRYWALTQAGFTVDEVCYCLGNQPETIFSINYCDYMNEGAQYVLYVKFRRIEVFLNQEDCVVSHAVMEFTDNDWHRIDAAEGMPLQLEIEVFPDANGQRIINLDSIDLMADRAGLPDSGYLEFKVFGGVENVD